MGLIKWKRIKPLKSQTAISEIEQTYNLSIPSEVKACITQNNGGRPVPNTISVDSKLETDIKCLLSYNSDDKDSIFPVINFFIENYKGTLLPFAMDSSGNYFCMKGSQVVLWTQDMDVVPVCHDFASFLDSLYELN